MRKHDGEGDARMRKHDGEGDARMRKHDGEREARMTAGGVLPVVGSFTSGDKTKT